MIKFIHKLKFLVKKLIQIFFKLHNLTFKNCSRSVQVGDPLLVNAASMYCSVMMHDKAVKKYFGFYFGYFVHFLLIDNLLKFPCMCE